MNKFSITRRYTPAKPRAASLQGSGVVTVNFSTSVTESLGSSQEIASTVVNNYYEGEASNYKGRITISNLLAIPAADISNNDLYLVYSEGSDGSGWSVGGEFTYEGKTYPDGTFFQYINGAWAAVDADEVDLSNAVKMSELKEEMWLVESTFNNTSYWNLYGESKTGMAIATIGRYRLNADGVYEPYNEVKGTSGSAYYSENYTKTLYVPYARSYQSGGETVYQGGMLTAADYERLMQGGGGSDVTIDTSLPSNPSDEHVPSTKLFKTTLASYPLKSELSAVATSGNYSDLNGTPSAVTDSVVGGWGYTKNVGTITEVKLNGTSVATSGSVDLNVAVNKRINGGTDLNTLLEPGFYYCASNHNCVNAHNTANPFGMVVVHSALGDYYAQFIFDYWGKIYHRFKGGQSNTWSAWTERTVVTDSTVSGWGYTKNAGTITEVKLNGTSLATSGSVNITAPVSKQLTSGSLNSVTDPGIYFAGGGNACTNVATSAGNAFGLIVTKTAGSNYYQQTFYDYFGKEFKRFCKGGTWSAWKSAQANWNETDANSASYIQNKPSLDNYMLKSDALSALFLGKITLYLDAYAKKGVMQYCNVTLRDSEYLNGWTLTASTYNTTNNKFRCDVVLTNSGISLLDFVSSHTYITLVTAGTTYSVNNLSSITHVNVEGSGSKVTFLIDIGTLSTSYDQSWSSNIMISMLK